MAVLTFKIEKKEYKSKPFDFKAMCLINEKHNDKDNKGVLVCGDDAVRYLFEGTDGEKKLESVAPGIYANLCVNAWNMYIEELSRKND